MSLPPFFKIKKRGDCKPSEMSEQPITTSSDAAIICGGGSLNLNDADPEVLKRFIFACWEQPSDLDYVVPDFNRQNGIKSIDTDVCKVIDQ